MAVIVHLYILNSIFDEYHNFFAPHKALKSVFSLNRHKFNKFNKLSNERLALNYSVIYFFVIFFFGMS